MTNIELLKLESKSAFGELLVSIDGVSEQQSWARIECQPKEYMHTEGSVLSIVLHIAACKFIYDSTAYRELEVRWRDRVARLESFWPSWEGAKQYLSEAEEYWLSSWAEDVNVEEPVRNFRGLEWPSWKVISTVIHHDSYHAGQIQMLRSVLSPSPVPPPEEGDLWRKYCGELPSW